MSLNELVKILKERYEEDNKEEPFADQEYVNEIIRLCKVLASTPKDNNPKDRALIDLVNEIYDVAID